ncbi:imidazole glycerol phosphate synthase subunit HisH [Syntrophomonas palmitatica]|uniref:imidazole glycerol phosphate synthase subunit HisH n=1 Tax=Syntrophomonas palmitatica TaxID=402877 RepID=UPI0006CF8ED7|nr:imidazole glycerol phosphate synthase subunit HisH [Syntrophomonas palmitatica]
MNVIIIDYGMGNLHSIRRALEECGANAVIASNPGDLRNASQVVLPGVGAFADAMHNLNTQGWIPAIKQTVDEGVPLLGICLGMQLLADWGDEGGGSPGLGFIPGEVIKFQLEDYALRIPHVGWNEIEINREHQLLCGIANRTDFYFVHSYHFVAREEKNVLTTTSYGIEFVSAVVNKNVIGVQFHPEKSQRAGFAFIKNFLQTI